MFLWWCHVSLIFQCIAVYSFEESVTFTSLYWLVFREKCLLLALLGILRLFQVFLWICTALSCEGVFKLVCLLSILKRLAQWWQPPVCWMLTFIGFLQIPESSFLCVLTSHLQVRVSTLRSMHREPVIKWGCVVRYTACWQGAYKLFGRIHRQDILATCGQAL